MRSMTGFGRGQAAANGLRIEVEASSLNRKQAEVVVQCPRELAPLEERIRRRVMERIARGRVQLAVVLDRGDAAATVYQVDLPLAKVLDEAVAGLGRALGRPLAMEAADFLRQPGILTATASGIDLEAIWKTVAAALDAALDELVTMRAREGDDLRADCLARLATLDGLVGRMADRAEERPARQRELLLKRLADAGIEFDREDDRVVREIALFADRCCITEELTRLASHFDKFREYLAGADHCGRALDFLCQEIFREFNTIGSKANDAAVAHLVVEAKTELEKIREQIQNVE